MNRKIITSFFADVHQYDHFLLFRNEQRKRDSDFTCFALLEKEDDRFLYSIELRDEVSKEVFNASEYVRPFNAVQHYLDLFNQGVAECARRLQAYIATGQIDSGLPAFGILSCDSPDETAPAPPPYNYVDNDAADEPEINETSQDTGRLLFSPNILESKMAKRYKAGAVRVYLLTDVISAGSVPISHMLIAYEGEDRSPIYAVAAEYVDPSYRAGGSHFLCTYDGTSHSNFGCIEDWGDINEFEKRACELMSVQLGTSVVEV